MYPPFDDFYERLETIFGEVKEAIEGLPAEALDRVPGPEMNSLAVLAVHLAGATRYWIGDVVGQDLSGRDRDAEFQTAGLDGAALAERLDEVLAHSRSVLEVMTLESLNAVCESPRDGRMFTAGWALFHALEHAALHLGHVQITRQLVDGSLE